ncbi:MAG: hypothetical protein MN733_18050 [Nitrososphaera sp.]|nr:hypothetical protein [Nitrososphaera sp.]
MSKLITHGEVMRLHDAWAHKTMTYGAHDQGALNAHADYYEAQHRYEREHGKPFVPKHRRCHTIRKSW